jgi:hypothetical protein
VVVDVLRSIGNFGITINVGKKPFDDERGRLVLIVGHRPL